MLLSDILQKVRNLRGPKTHLLHPSGGVLHSRGGPFIIKRGKWVVVGEGRVGIVNDLSQPGKVGVMCVNGEGEDQEQTYWPVGDLTIAPLLAIPEKRRPHPDHGASIGYF